MVFLELPIVIQSKAIKKLYGIVMEKTSKGYYIKWSDGIECYWPMGHINYYANVCENQKVARLLYINEVGGAKCN